VKKVSSSTNKIETPQESNQRKFIVLDIVFYGSSLNYDQGTTNYQELKKITKWDGKQYVLVSRYALRHSILHWANKLYPNEWKLAGNKELEAEEGGVVHPKPDLVKKNKSILNFPEFDLFGFMIAQKGKEEVATTRVSPVKVSHALSLTPYSYDSHFMANLDVMRRAGGKGSNPVTIEEKSDFYAYNLIIDVSRVGKYTVEEHGDQEVGDIIIDENMKKERIIQLIETVLNLKREIKGRMEDLSPWLAVIGLYNDGKYETYLDKMELAKSNLYKIITKEKETRDEEGRVIREIEHEIVEKNAPKFIIDINSNSAKLVESKDKLLSQIKDFLSNKITGSTILIYKRKFIQTDPEFQPLTLEG
jgi:CRISPR-associated protein Cst2